MSKKENKKEPEIDYEKLYYQAMQENVLIKDKKISFEFTEAEINYLRDLMFNELLDLKYDITDYGEEDEKEENKLLGKNAKKDEFLKKMIDEKRMRIEQIIRKLRFEVV